MTNGNLVVVTALGTLTASMEADTTGTGSGGSIAWNYKAAAAAVEYLAGRSSRARECDLAACERTIDRYVQDRLVWAMLEQGRPDARAQAGDQPPFDLGEHALLELGPDLGPVDRQHREAGQAGVELQRGCC